jgi:nicotinamidase-related amidase
MPPRTVEVPPYEIEEAIELDPRTSALVVVDMQRDFVHPDGALPVAGAPQTVPRIARLLELARGAGLLVCFTQDSHRDDDPEWAIWGRHAERGTPGWEIVPELAPGPDELVFEKARYDGFYGTSLDHELRVRGIRTVVVCGTVANICVHYTAASAALRWFDVVIPKDATSALDPFDLESSLRQTSFLFNGKITQSAAIKATV